MQEVDFGAIVKNALFFKKKLSKSKLCAVVKNDAYGHGIVRTASALSDIADYFAVGSLKEALEVRQFCKNVLILLPLLTVAETKTAVENGISLTVDSFRTLETVQKSVDFQKAKIHVALETGMNRLGFTEEQLPRLARAIDKNKVTIEGAFSHFWGESQKSCDAQLAKFQAYRDYLVSKTESNAVISHIANTSAVLLNDKYHLDMARVGLGLYGYGNKSLVHAKTVKAQVVALRNVKAGQTVGYGAAYKFSADTRIAIVNAGYANGFSRAVVPAKVKINGKIFPTVGNICMAMCAVDVGDETVDVGDEAILLGKGVNNENANVIVYELLCNLK